MCQGVCKVGNLRGEGADAEDSIIVPERFRSSGLEGSRVALVPISYTEFCDKWFVV